MPRGIPRILFLCRSDRLIGKSVKGLLFAKIVDESVDRTPCNHLRLWKQISIAPRVQRPHLDLLEGLLLVEGDEGQAHVEGLLVESLHLPRTRRSRELHDCSTTESPSKNRKHY